MGTIENSITGKLKFDRYWKKEQNISIFRNQKKVEILFDGEPDENLEEDQILAYKSFLENQKQIIDEVEDSIFRYYIDLAEEKNGGLPVNQRIPHDMKKGDLRELVNLHGLLFPWSFGSGERQIGFLFDCVWEPEHGLGVKVINEHVAEVGYQDIIL